MKQSEARIHSVETFGTLDGPGIRYVLFFQGCPLQCRYCQNRDTWDHRGGELRSIDSLVENILGYRGFMVSSGGGLTASGGEPLLQADFVGRLFAEMKENRIHTALDTSGYTELSPAVAKLLDNTDLVLLDLKQMDDTAHRVLTGVSNGRILEFAEEVSRRKIPIWIRHVIVPGYTANRNSAEKTALFVAGLRGVERVELLPYHELGRFKWEALGKKYPLEGVKPPDTALMEELRTIFRTSGVEQVF